LKLQSCFFLFFIFLFQYLYSQDSLNIKNYSIGENILKVHTTIFYPYSHDVSFINIHDDENTSVDAVINFLSRNGGILFQLQHSGKRIFAFKLNGELFAFDPNRIFTNNGVKATLEKHSIYKEDAALEVKKFADSLLNNYVNKKKLVIALHNNTERGLSILSYKKGGFEYKNAAKVHINSLMNPHDFILTTSPSYFHQLKRKNSFTAMLQLE
jgi:hypothetical protein